MYQMSHLWDILKTVEDICKYFYRELSTKCNWHQLNVSWKKTIKRQAMWNKDYIKHIKQGKYLLFVRDG